MEKKVHQRDSLMQSDSLAIPPPETFLQTLYKRKKRILLASQEREIVQVKNVVLDNLKR
jgi:hypothetical protein